MTYEYCIDRPVRSLLERWRVYSVEVHPVGQAAPASYWRSVTTEHDRAAAETVAASLEKLGKGIDGVRLVVREIGTDSVGRRSLYGRLLAEEKGRLTPSVGDRLSGQQVAYAKGRAAMRFAKLEASAAAL